MNERVAAPLSIGPLPAGHVINGFTIQRLIGTGGFSLVYSAWDPKVEREVAIKEYMPTSLAVRSATQHVTVLSQSYLDTFELGLRSFVNEARVLGRLDHENLVRVYHFWEENNTAYLAMPLYGGQTSKAARQAMHGIPDEAWLRGILDSVLSVLDYLHGQQIFHRDIAPDNILIRDDGRPLVLDFGAARRVIRDNTQTLTAILKPHYAPVEQYGETPSLRQGPWTDLYALGATMYYLITGQPPLPSTARAMGDGGLPLASRGIAGLSPSLLRTVDAMMAPHPQSRPASAAEVRSLLQTKVSAVDAPAVVHGAEAAEALVAPVADGGFDDDRTVVHFDGRQVHAPVTGVKEAVAGHGNAAHVGGEGPVAASALPANPRQALRKRFVGTLAAAVGLLVLALLIGLISGNPRNVPLAEAAAQGATASVDAAASAASSSVAAAHTQPLVLPAELAEERPAESPVATAMLPKAGAPSAAAGGRAGAAARGAAASVNTAQAPAVSVQPDDVVRPEPKADEAPPPAAESAPRAVEAKVPDAQHADPREACGGRRFIALDMCMRRQCALREVAPHPECGRVRGICELNSHAHTDDCKLVLDTWKGLGR